MDINLLVNLTSRAWALPILAQMQAGVPGRQAALLAATGASRGGFAQSLAHVMEMGLVERNPGHGHPLRPEYRLTVKGAVVAPVAARVLAVAPEGEVLRRAWSLPILAVTGAPRGFTAIRKDLGRVTDRALSQSLEILQDQHLLIRGVDVEARPLRPIYQAHGVGLELSRLVQVGGGSVWP